MVFVMERGSYGSGLGPRLPPDSWLEFELSDNFQSFFIFSKNYSDFQKVGTLFEM